MAAKDAKDIKEAKKRAAKADAPAATAQAADSADPPVLATSAYDPSLEGQQFAAVDLGSNSFHMIVSRYAGGSLQLMDRLRDPVRLAQGLTEDGTLAGSARERAMACLAQFGQRLRGLKSERVRTVATNTVRQLKNPRAFLQQAEAALGFPIEIISGREEGRLTYLGVASAFPERKKRRLLVDIGGGSTELILGQGFEVFESESIQMGCVGTTKRYFADGKVSRKYWKDVQQSLALEFAPFRSNYVERGWKSVLGSSGTLKATANILQALGGPELEISRDGLNEIIDRVLHAGELQKIKLPDLSDDRRLVYLGGLAAIDACFRELEIQHMQVSLNALREGLLLDMLGRISHTDPRAESVRALAKRHSVDFAHAKRVKQIALSLFTQVKDAWQLDDDAREALAFASILHEIGLSISHSQHHQHGAYIVANTDLAGFTREEQQSLAAILRCHRRSVPEKAFDALPERARERSRKLSVLLRLAGVLQRARQAEAIPRLKITAAGGQIKLRFAHDWLEQHPLTRADLRQEKPALEALGVKLVVASLSH
jgi:exopolyphosphatase / guanosine-5'-triphosphate,3'-diphosphate pyrophosphatase